MYAQGKTESQEHAFHATNNNLYKLLWLVSGVHALLLDKYFSPLYKTHGNKECTLTIFVSHVYRGQRVYHAYTLCSSYIWETKSGPTLFAPHACIWGPNNVPRYTLRSPCTCMGDQERPYTLCSPYHIGTK